MNKEKRPIGIFDSGVGGLTVFSEVRKRFPAENIIYFGDTARVPYGPKSSNTIKQYSIQNARFLINNNVKLIVIACNTSSAVAINYLKQEFKVPVVGVIDPGAEAAVNSTKTGNIGIIGTEGTIRSQAYPEAIKRINPNIETISISCPLFVPLVEEGWHNHHIAYSVIEEYLAPIIAKKVDTLVLGCTHYPILKNAIKKVVGEGITLIDSAEAVARYLDNYLQPDNKQTGNECFYVSDNQEKFHIIASNILNREINNIRSLKLGEGWFLQDD